DLNERLLGLKLRGVGHDGFALARAGGELPHGRMGEVLFADQRAIVERVATKLAPLASGHALDPVAFDITAGKLRFVGALENLTEAGMLDYRMAGASVNLRLRAWIRHLALNAFAPREVGRV